MKRLHLWLKAMFTVVPLLAAMQLEGCGNMSEDFTSTDTKIYSMKVQVSGVTQTLNVHLTPKFRAQALEHMQGEDAAQATMLINIQQAINTNRISPESLRGGMLNLDIKTTVGPKDESCCWVTLWWCVECSPGSGNNPPHP